MGKKQNKTKEKGQVSVGKERERSCENPILVEIVVLKTLNAVIMRAYMCPNASFSNTRHCLYLVTHCSFLSVQSLCSHDMHEAQWKP